MAIRISGIPRVCGIANWSKKLNVMVRFRMWGVLSLVLDQWGC